ncbi:MAG: 6-carboxytetrahydropterin synthase, partial [Rhodothermales bacterium]
GRGSDGDCRHLHGHSYRMVVGLEGDLDDHGIVVDFKDIKRIVKPLVDAWDHATLIAEYDRDLMQAVELLNSRYFVLPFDSTCENMCRYVADRLRQDEKLMELRIRRISVRVHETETSYAELSVPIAARDAEISFMT